MTPALTLLARAVEDAADARFILSQLVLERRPRTLQEARELALFRALAPVLATHGGNPAAVRAHCPPEHREALTVALALSDWWHRRCEPLPKLVALWTAGRSREWEIPDRVPAVTAPSSDEPPAAAPVTLSPRRAPVPSHALPLWQKRERLRGPAAPFLDPLHRAAILEAQVQDAERFGLHTHTAGWLEKLRALREDEAAKQRRAQRAELRRDALALGRMRDDAA